MDNKNIMIDTNSITKTMKLMSDKCKELISVINEYKDMFNATKLIYDTGSADLYRETALEYLDLIENYVENDFMTYINKLDDIKNTYANEFSAISAAINGE